MSITTASLSDTLSSTVPMLDASGCNWAIFVFRFQDAVEAKGFWDHFDGSASRPIAANATPTAMETIAMSQWDKDELGKIVTYTEVAGFNSSFDPWEENSEGKMGGSREGVFEEERI